MPAAERRDEDSRRALPAGLRPGGRFAEWAPGVPAYVVADVDGTLIAAAGTATPGVARAVRDAHAAGLRVGFATGRLPGGLTDLARQLEPVGPHIVHNGAQVRERGRPVATWPLAPGAAGALTALAAEHGWYLELYVGEGFYATDRRPEAVAVWERISGPPAGLTGEVDPDAAEVIKGSVVAWTPPELPPMLEAIGALGLKAQGAPSPLFPGATFVNVTAPEADKGAALVYAAAHLGVPLDAVVAVGDGLNDLSMLAVAGTAVAMGQAPPELQAAAHVVVPDVDADGVAHALDAAVAWRS